MIDRSLAGLATGAVDRVWYSADGSSLYIRTSAGRTFLTSDFETWRAANADAPVPAARIIPARLPENNAQVRTGGARSSRLYAIAKFAYKSDNGGASWDNLTGYRSTSIVGDVSDLAVSPANEDEVAVAGAAGVFRSLDGGKSWSGLNQGLPNLPAWRLLGLPSGDRGVRLALADSSAVEWEPGQKQAWLPADNSDFASELRQRQALSALTSSRVTALTAADKSLYTGTDDGRITVYFNGGSTAPWSVNEGGPVERFWVDPKDSRIAIAVLSSRPHDSSSTATPVHVLRTVDGARWDDITGNLPDIPVYGVTADRASGAIYIATSRGVFQTTMDLATIGGPAQWTQVPGLPTDAPVTDVSLDAGYNQLWAAVYGYGAYSTLAPHRFRDPRVLSAADFVARAAAPGSLVSVAGLRVDSAQANHQSVPVLAATDTESQIQIPFEARGSSISLDVSLNGSIRTLPAVALQPVAPAIFVNVDGSPMLLDAGTGVMLDAMTPAHSRSRVQILATGLGRVTPDWPTGLAAPADNPPVVAATVHAFLDRVPVEVTRAVLAPYVGFYLVEIEIPKIVNYGPAELYLEVNGQMSNRVRIYIEPGS